MQQFFQTLSKGDQQSEQLLDDVLKGGKNDVKRASSVDTTLYGTQAGVEAKKQWEQQQAIAEENKLQMKLAAQREEQKEARKDTVAKVVTVGTVVGIAAAAVAFLVGGNRSR